MTASVPPRPHPRPWSLVVNADDYALSPGVSAGILDLLRDGRISATSVMSASPFWPEHAPDLAALGDRADVGLHVTLTDQRALAPVAGLTGPDARLPPLGTLMRLAHAGRLDADAIRAELTRQLEALERHLGRPPDFVDGHQHVHVLPGIRPVLLDVLARRYRPGSVYVRDCAEPLARLLRRPVARAKALVVATLSRGLGRQARRLGLPVNSGFRGLYGFEPDGDVRGLMRHFLAPPADGAILMVHPARPDTVLAGIDSLVEPRYREFAYLAGPDWPADLAAAGAVVGRFRKTVPAPR